MRFALFTVLSLASSFALAIPNPIPNPIPLSEPSPLWLLGIGAAALAAMSRSKRK